MTGAYILKSSVSHADVVPDTAFSPDGEDDDDGSVNGDVEPERVGVVLRDEYETITDAEETAVTEYVACADGECETFAVGKTRRE